MHLVKHVNTGKTLHCIVFLSIVYCLAFGFGVYMSHGEASNANFIKINFFDLLLHNMQHLFIMLCVGLITFGIGSTFLLAVNALNTGSAVILVFNADGILPILTNFLPHCIFEIVSTILFASLGLLSLNILLSISHKGLFNKIYSILKGNAVILFFACFLLLIAALVESME
ncbi:MAG: stage II sporulation protein M [Candidatus Ancillula sp.]|nr:stage II sporulation protein M [Candidatus Ancillula sp.]